MKLVTTKGGGKAEQTGQLDQSQMIGVHWPHFRNVLKLKK